MQRWEHIVPTKIYKTVSGQKRKPILIGLPLSWEAKKRQKEVKNER